MELRRGERRSIQPLRLSMGRTCAVLTTALVIGILGVAQSEATICIVPNNGGSPQMPPECTDGYVSPQEAHMIIDGAPPGSEIVVDVTHREFGLYSSGPGGGLGGEFEQFTSSLMLEMQGTGTLASFSKTIVMPVDCETHIGPRNLGDPVQDFDTEFVRIDGQIFGDPDFDLLRIQAGSSFGLPSPGHTTLTRLGPPGSDFQVDSFFDIEYRIEFQGAPGGALSGLGGITTDTVRMQAGEPDADTECSACGPGPHWIDICAANTDTMPTSATVTVDTNLDGTIDTTLVMSGPTVVTRSNPLDVSSQFPGELPDGHIDVMDTEIVSLSLTGGGATLTAGSPFGLPPSLGRIKELPSDSTLGAGFFDVFFEIYVGGGVSLFNHDPIRVESIIDCVPPKAHFVYDGPAIPLYDTPDATGVHVADVYFTDHETYPPPPPPPPDDHLTLDPTKVQFGGGQAVPTIPANFFGPSSDPFSGDVQLTGPLPGERSVRLQRSEDPVLLDDPVGTMRTVDIEMVSLSLVSSSPITVTYGGTSSELWDLRVSNIGSSGQDGVRQGSLTATKDHSNGGTFFADVFLCPVLTFTRLSDGTEKTLDLCPTSPPDPAEAMQLTLSGHFVHNVDPALGVWVPEGALFVTGIEHEDIGGAAQQIIPILATTLDTPPSVEHWVGPIIKVCIYRVQCRNITDPANPDACDQCPLACGDLCQGSQCPNDTCSTGYSTTCGPNGCCLRLEWTFECRPPSGEPACPTQEPCSCGLPGACCDLASGSCTIVDNECDCQGSFIPGVDTCQPVGACCFDADGDGSKESCTEIAEVCCEDIGGDFRGGLCDTDGDGMDDACHACQTDADCDDGDDCTIDRCLADGTCQNTLECTSDADCDDGDDCTTDTCGADGCCVNRPDCTTDADCNDLNVCTTDTCGADHCCDFTPECINDTDCDDGIDCTVDSCNAAGCCEHTPDCIATCVIYDGATGVSIVTDCDCIDPNQCRVDTPAQGGLALREPGDACTVTDNGTGTVTLPPAGCDYLSPDEFHEIADGLPPGTTIQLGAIHKDFICRDACGDPVSSAPCTVAGGILGGEVECFDSTLELDVSFASPGRGVSSLPRTIVIPDVSCWVHTGPRNPGDAVQDFDNEMFRLEGALPAGDPDFQSLTIVAGLDFGLPSPGHTTLTRLGPPGSDFAVDSFFDITYRIDFEGAPGGVLDGMSGSTTGTVRMSTGSMPSCVGTCPDPEDCVETIVDLGNGQFEICCSCVSEPVEACCLPDATCVDATPEDCACFYNGIPQGPGTDCTTVECPVNTIWTGMNIDIHQDNPDVVANDFHMEGIIESSAVPVVVDHVDDLFTNFSYSVTQDQPSCPAGSIWWCFQADWSGADYPFCTILHLGLVFEVVCHNVMIDLTGWWTVDGNPVGGGDKFAELLPAQPGFWPMLGFDVEDNIRVPPNSEPLDPRGQNILLRNGNANGIPEPGEIPVEIIQLDLAAISSSELDTLLGSRPLDELRIGGREADLPWVPVLNPAGELVSPTNPTPMNADDEIMVLLRPAPGFTEHQTQVEIEIPPGGYLIARQLVRFEGNGPAFSEEIHWFWELHGAHELPQAEACCLPDATCVDDLLPSQCLCENGTPQGFGVRCAGILVACCFDDGSCQDLDPLCCEDMGGTPQTFGSACLGNGSDEIDDACQPPELVCPLPEPAAVDPCSILQSEDCQSDDPTSTTVCQPRCADYDAAVGVVTVTDCECMEPDDCRLEVSDVGGQLRLAGPSDPCVVPDDATGTITLPPAGCEYLSPDEVHEILSGVGSATIEFDAIHRDFVCGGANPDVQPACSIAIPPGDCEAPGGSLGGQVDCFDSTLELKVEGTGDLAGFNRTLFPQINCEVHTGPRNPGDAVQDFDTEMFRLQGELFGDPDFCTFRVSGGSSLGFPSPGHTTLTRLGPPGSDFAVDSFFDIEYQIEFQGCPGSVLEGMSGTVTGKVRMETGLKPSCVGSCAANEVCSETVTDNPDGSVHICCECKPDVIVVPPVVTGVPHNVRKNRYLSINPSTNGDNEVAYRVDLVEMNRCSGDLRRACSSDEDCPRVCDNDANITCSSDAACRGGTCIETTPCIHHPDEGLSWWVQEPQQEPLGCRLPGGCTDEDWFARLDSTPHFRTWNDFGVADSSVLHISDCQITPVATYAVQACAPPTGDVCSDPLIIGTILRPPPGNYGDVVGPVDPVTIEFDPPNQILSVGDISGYLLTNQNYGLPGDPKPQAHWTWVDMEGQGAPFYRPQGILNVGDLNQILFGLMGRPFSWAGNNVDPGDCP